MAERLEASNPRSLERGYKASDERAPATACARLVFVSNRELHRARFVVFGAVWPFARSLSRVWPGEPFTLETPR